MWNILLDPLPEDWKGYPIDTDFQTGIQISQCMEDEEFSEREKVYRALCMLFPKEDKRPPYAEAQEALAWYLTAFDHDNHIKKETHEKVMDFDVDQWRIYAAFMQQYHIDLNRERMHWFVFMGLLANLEESSFSRVISIRQKKLTSKMGTDEKKYYAEAKKVYALGTKEEILTEEEKQEEAEALEIFNKMRKNT